MKFDLDMVDIYYGASNPLRPAEPDDCLVIYDIQAKLAEINDNDEVKRTEIAMARLILLDRLIYEPEATLFEACDAYSQELCNLYENIFDDGEPCVEPLDEVIGAIWYLERIYVYPEYRNQGLGEAIIDWITKYICRDMGAIVLFPMPIKIEGNSINIDENQDLIEKLHKFYKKSGFFQLQGTKYFCRVAEWKKTDGDHPPVAKLTRVK